MQNIMNEASLLNNPEVINPTLSNQTANYQMTANTMLYPEVFYKLQPFIMMVCDQMDSYGTTPSQEMVEQVSDDIHENACKMYPEMAEYANKYDVTVNDDKVVATSTFGPPFQFGYPHRMFGFRPRRRGMFRDLIEIMLLSELFRRRRRYW